MIIQVPEKVDFIINKLMEHGYEAYAVGGCVRDSILGRTPGDWDITTSASPYEVKQIFHRTIDTGIQHGTVTIMLDKEGFEVTTYRLDGEYEDCRHPKQVEFTKNLTEDLKRRDFTINAMAYNEKEGMVDLFEGLLDIERKVIRCVGSAMDRFEEDALRILRAVRFSAQLDFDIEKSTKEAIEKKVGNLSNISAERIREEINKLLLSKHPDHMMTAYETGITRVVFPEFDAFGDKELLLREIVIVASQAEQEIDLLRVKEIEVEHRKLTSKERLCLMYALLLQPEGQENHASDESLKSGINEKMADRAKKVMQRLKFDNDTIQMVTRLVKFQGMKIGMDSVSVRKAMNVMGLDLMDLWFAMKRIEIQASQELSMIRNPNRVDSEKDGQIWLDSIYTLYQASIREKECVNLKMLKITGKELIKIGFCPGVSLGITLDQLLKHVIEYPQDNELERLTALAELLKER